MDAITSLPPVIQTALGILMLGILLALLRLVLGPSIPDRVMALDVLANLCLGAFVIYAIGAEQPMFMDVAISIALIAFLSTVAFARYLERKATQ